MAEKGTISINAENIMPVIKKWLYSDKDIFVREVVSNGCDAVSKMKRLVAMGEAKTAEGEGDERAWTYNDAEVDLTEVTDALTALTADSFTDQAAAGQEEIALTLHLDNENHPAVTLRLTRYDGEHCLAEVDGESTALVARADAMALVEAVQAIVLG